MNRDPNIESLIVNAYCCRAWPVITVFKVGRCGICGERPVTRR
jgi:hypothetical protein